MTQEQYKKAVEIDGRLRELNEVKRALEGTEKHRLTYSYKGEHDWHLCPDWVMSPIVEILDKHDLMIRQEIEDEIKKLKKEIETL